MLARYARADSLARLQKAFDSYSEHRNPGYTLNTDHLPIINFGSSLTTNHVRQGIEAMPRTPKKAAKKPAQKKPTPAKAAKKAAPKRAGTAPPATLAAAPSKKALVRSCVLATFRTAGTQTGPDTTPKSIWSRVLWDGKADDIAVCVKDKIPSADQRAVRTLLTASFGTTREQIINDVAGIV